MHIRYIYIYIYIYIHVYVHTHVRTYLHYLSICLLPTYVSVRLFVWLFVSPCISECIPRKSVVRAFAHGTMGRRIDPSWWTHCAMSRSSQCSTTAVTKAVVYAILSVGWCI